jgi:nucleoside-diphosphate-sugar epimerase
MKCIVTGAAGFIGSTLTKKLLDSGWEVVGVDNFADFYPRSMKEMNLESIRGRESFQLVEEDLVTCELDPLFDGVDAVIHLAAQAGVRTSWGSEFRTYTDSNILATQRLLEASRGKALQRFVYASSSSVYGETQVLPLHEAAPVLPLSPYGVSKLAAERLCRLYWKNFDVPTISLRYFTVYGPGQRPDMSFHRFIKAMLTGGSFRIFGTGEQTRDFTFVEDAAEVTMNAITRGAAGGVYNIGGGNRVSLKEVVELMAALTSTKPDFQFQDFEKGDMMHTMADATLAREELGYLPRTDIEAGLKAEIDWLKRLIGKEG